MEWSTARLKLFLVSLVLSSPTFGPTSLLIVWATMLCSDSRELLFTMPRFGPTSRPASSSDWGQDKGGRRGKRRGREGRRESEMEESDCDRDSELTS